MEKKNNKMKNILSNVCEFYRQGFHEMTLGKTLWTIIIIKLIIIFAVLKVFFFPDYIDQNDTEGDAASFVAGQVIERNH